MTIKIMTHQGRLVHPGSGGMEGEEEGAEGGAEEEGEGGAEVEGDRTEVRGVETVILC